MKEDKKIGFNSDVLMIDRTVTGFTTFDEGEPIEFGDRFILSHTIQDAVVSGERLFFYNQTREF